MKMWPEIQTGKNRPIKILVSRHNNFLDFDISFSCDEVKFGCVVFGRGHTVRAVTESFQMSKDAGFKVVAHMMPDLPNVGLERDIEQFIVSKCLLSINTIKITHCDFKEIFLTNFVRLRNSLKTLHLDQMD